MKRVAVLGVLIAALATVGMAQAKPQFHHQSTRTFQLGALPGEHAHAAFSDGWTGLAYTPDCFGPITMWASCNGASYGYTNTGAPAWNQVESCSGQLLAGGWQRLACYWFPTAGTHLTNLSGGDAPTFEITHCGRYYSTYTFLKVLLAGGWQSGSSWAPGIKVRCPA